MSGSEHTTIAAPLCSDRNGRLERALEKLTDVSTDLNTLLAVHEQRINQQEKDLDSMHDSIELRRAELQEALDKVYKTMHDEDMQVVAKLDVMRLEQISQYEGLTEKLNTMQRYFWMYIGGFTAVIFFISNSSQIISLFTN